ncbi:MAG TPA: hypothetical protein VN851_17430 [Thermoanaerobaculia bacterium]|nr:hypothetical protein [Thermoanaerobaculia bacterium]
MKSVPSVALIVLSAARALLAAQPVSLALTPEQVTCEERQMGRLIHRLSVAYNGSSLFLWRSSPEGGAYEGLVGTNEMHFVTQFGDRSREENQLAFDLILRAEADFLNPRRSVLPQASLVRRDTASNLDVPISGNGNLLIRMDLAPEVPNPDTPTIPLKISTQREPGREKADGAGRGLVVDDLLTPCHGEVTEFDQRVFAILARTVRPTACLSDPPGSPGCSSDRFKTVFYRGMEPFTYRIDVFLYSAHCNDNGTCTYGEGRIPFLFRIRVNDRSRLLDGTADAFPFCETSGQLDCIDPGNPWIAVYVLPPLRPGVEVQDEPFFQRSARLNIDFIGSEFNVLHADVSWEDLLRDTAWNGGLAPTGEGLP